MAYEKDFRTALGFSNKDNLKNFYKAKDITIINWEKIEACNTRLEKICIALNKAIHKDISFKDITVVTAKIDDAYHTMRDHDLIPHLKNQGRNPDDVYYNWMRGYILCELFRPGIAKLFQVNVNQISQLGHDDLTHLETFSRSATADLQIMDKNGNPICLEIQGGFTGVNDIKASKIKEAKEKARSGIVSYIIHFDVYNGKAAVVEISNPNTAHLNALFVSNPKFEGVETLPIDETWFKWKLSEPMLPLQTMAVKL